MQNGAKKKNELQTDLVMVQGSYPCEQSSILWQFTNLTTLKKVVYLRHEDEADANKIPS